MLSVNHKAFDSVKKVCFGLIESGNSATAAGGLRRGFRRARRTSSVVALMLLALTLLGAPALATELVYQPVNPHFGGNPLNGVFLLNEAQVQNGFKDPDRRRFDDDPAAEFTRVLQSRLLSALANQVVEALFGENPQDSGQIVFGSQTLTFNRGVEMITIEIVDTATGAVTLIEVPTLQIES